MTYAEELFADIGLLLQSNESMPSRYRTMWRLLDRMLKERTESDQTEYQGLIPRIYALAQRYNTSQRPLCVLFSNILRVGKEEYLPGGDDFLYDVKALSQAVCAFYNTPIPTSIGQVLPETWRTLEGASTYSAVCIRFIVKEWNEQYLWGYNTEDPEQRLLKVAYAPHWKLNVQLYPLATINLLDVIEGEDGTLHPRLFILDPDYLVDITAVCHCFAESGPSPYFSLLDKFNPREETLATQIGNVANQFLDDTINENATFLRSMQKSFRDYPLVYCTLEGIDQSFFQQCQQHYDNIREVVGKHFKEAGIDTEKIEVQLEPSFVCSTLGLQGRMDLLTGDLTKIVELKSGKQDEFHGTFRMEHALQMALYKEILHYSLGRSRSEVKTLLLYSRYPTLYDVRLGGNHIEQALALRNGIVHIDRQLRTNSHEFLRQVKESDFNPLNSQSKLYSQFVKPRVEKFLAVLASASDLEYDYFCTMVSFVQREQLLAKVGDDRPDSDRGFAQAWLCDSENKRLRGNIITDLYLTPVLDENGTLTHVEALLIEDDLSKPNFREGDSVILYERNSEADVITNRQSLRCYVEELHSDHLLLRLGHPQHGSLGLHLESHYAIEPAHSDANFSSLYRGLYALLTCPLPRRELILGLRKPESDTTIKPIKQIDDIFVNEILNSAVQSQDYYLLVGPPGSGKTNIALRGMVEELLAQNTTDCTLLIAYTNRAVDEICQMLENIGTHPDYLRVGQELSCASAYRPRLIRNLIVPCHNRKEIMERLRPIRIVCGTVASLCSSSVLFRLKHFRTAILDEASQVLEPQLLPLLTHTSPDGTLSIERFFFIGDHKQLPAVVVQHPDESRVSSPELREIGLLDCRDSLFERLHRTSPAQFVGMLTRQGRMHQTINEFVCYRYYGNRLATVPLPHQIEPLDWVSYDSHNPMQLYVARHRIGVCDVLPSHRESNNKVNTQEAQSVALLVKSLYDLTVLNDLQWQPLSQIGIIVPFRGQIAMIRRALRLYSVPDCDQISIDTVERYQGSQRDVIIFSTVISQSYQLQVLSSPVESEGQLIDRKLNVALTRARKQFFLVGNTRLLRQADDYRKLIDYILRVKGEPVK